MMVDWEEVSVAQVSLLLIFPDGVSVWRIPDLKTYLALGAQLESFD